MNLEPIILKWDAYLKRMLLERAAMNLRHTRARQERTKREAYRGPPAKPQSQGFLAILRREEHEAQLTRWRQDAAEYARMSPREQGDADEARRREAEIARNIHNYGDDAYRHGMA